MINVIKWPNSHVKQCLIFSFKSALRTEQTRAINCRFMASSRKNHYDTLGIPPSATQSEIKHAYYELSKTFHPDKNKGNEYYAQKFREIAAAYEVLGNHRTRRLYDKGASMHFGSRPSNKVDEPEDEEPEPVVEDDAETKFYKQHMQRGKAPGYSNSTEFDEYTKRMVTRGFEGAQAGKQKKKEYREAMAENNVVDEDQSMALLVVALLVIVVVGIVIIDKNTGGQLKSSQKTK